MFVSRIKNNEYTPGNAINNTRSSSDQAVKRAAIGDDGSGSYETSISEVSGYRVLPLI